MHGILADNNNEGHVAVLLGHLQKEPWRELWLGLNLSVQTFEEIDLERDASDSLLWQTCQLREVILITQNRNARGPESLEATIRTQNTFTSLPIFTLGNADRVLADSDYAERAALRLLEYLLDIEKVRGTGRLYLP